MLLLSRVLLGDVTACLNHGRCRLGRRFAFARIALSSDVVESCGRRRSGCVLLLALLVLSVFSLSVVEVLWGMLTESAEPTLLDIGDP